MEDFMNNRQRSKLKNHGTLITIKGTSCVFMVKGMKDRNTIDSFNGFYIKTGMVVKSCDGICRLATKREQSAYWSCLRKFTESL